MANPHKDYELEKPFFSLIEKEQWIKQPTSSDTIMGYGNIVYENGRLYAQEMVENGMPADAVDRVLRCTNAYEVTASRYDTVIDDSKLKVMWKEGKEKALKLRRQLFIFGEFAYEEYPELLEQLNEIIEGRGDLDMIYDLLKLYELFRSNIEPFAVLKKFSEDMLEETVELHNEMLKLYRMINCPEEVVAEIEREHKQAMTHLFHAIRQLRKWVKVTYYDNEAVMDKFKATWLTK